jgi:hypothetical protein
MCVTYLWRELRCRMRQAIFIVAAVILAILGGLIAGSFGRLAGGAAAPGGGTVQGRLTTGFPDDRI